MKFCKTCNKNYKEELMFCPKCGSLLINTKTKSKTNKNKKSSRNPGVFKLINKRSGEIFVGHSKNINQGIRKHLTELQNNRHRNKELQNDFNKGDKFDSEILEEFSYYDIKELHKSTNYWITKENSYKRGYNRSPAVGYNPYEQNKNHKPGGRLKKRNRKKSKK